MTNLDPDIFIGIFSLFCLLGVLLNAGTMVAIVACRSLRKTQNIFTFNVALGDFVSSFVVALHEWIIRWLGIHYTRNVGVTLGSIQEAAWMVGIFSTLAVAVHRFIIIRLDPFQNRRIVTATRCVITCVIMWAVALAFYLYIYLKVTHRYTYFPFVFPVSIMCAIGITAICYTVVYITISKPASDIGLSSDAYLLRVKRNKKVLWTFILVVFSNFVCWAAFFFCIICLSTRPRPSFILTYNPEYDWYDNANWFENLFYVGMWLVSINTIINPILYWTRLSDFRRLICSCCGRRDLKDSLSMTKDSKIESKNELSIVVAQGASNHSPAIKKKKLFNP